MNKSELVEVAAKEAGITKAAADKALSAIIGAVVKTVAEGRVCHPGWFRHIQVRSARSAHRQESQDRCYAENSGHNGAEIHRRYRFQGGSRPQEVSCQEEIIWHLRMRGSHLNGLRFLLVQ